MSILTSFVPSRTLVAAATSLLGAAGAIAQTPATPAISVYYDQAHGEAPPPPPMAELASDENPCRIAFSTSTAEPDALDGEVVLEERKFLVECDVRTVAGI